MATKKSFKGTNPAMQFITTIEENEPVPVLAPEAAPAPVPQAADTIPIPRPPALEVLPSAHAEMDSAVTPPAGATISTRSGAERKSKRLNLLLQPSIMEDLSKVAHMKQKSVNDLINTVLKEYCGNQQELIEKYDMIFSEE